MMLTIMALELLCWVSFMVNVIMLSVTNKPFMLNVAMLNVVAPIFGYRLIIPQTTADWHCTASKNVNKCVIQSGLEYQNLHKNLNYYFIQVLWNIHFPHKKINLYWFSQVKHTSLVHQSLIYGPKKSIKLVPEDIFFKHFERNELGSTI